MDKEELEYIIKAVLKVYLDMRSFTNSQEFLEGRPFTYDHRTCESGVMDDYEQIVISFGKR
jgi:hypothetical protein